MAKVSEVIFRIKGDAKQLNSELAGAEKSSAGFASKIGGKFVSIFKGIIAAAAIGKFIGKSLTEGADLQQSLGGIETLFKGSADKVKAYADEAYRTSGLSANDYMESVTSFSASLLQSLGGDTEKAADVANMALIDMSDNANKMGSSMEDIQNAYQGFAKQNYTMLDNLKLGYGGTKEEMSRLLADATKLTGVKYDISNLSDVYNAIHAVQEELGITGTTAKESAETFSGALASMKAAFSNVLGNLSLGRDIEPSLKALAETTATFLFGNFIPMVGNILKSLPKAIGIFIRESIPYIKEAFSNLLDSLPEPVANVIKNIENVIKKVANTIKKSLNIDLSGNSLISFLKTAGLSILTFVSTLKMVKVPGALPAMGKSFSVIGTAVMGLGGKIGAFIPTLLKSGSAFGKLSAVVRVLAASPIGIITAGIVGLSLAISSGALGNIDALVAKIGSFADTVVKVAPQIGIAFGKVIFALLAAISLAIPQIGAGMVLLIVSLGATIAANAFVIIGAFANVLLAILSALTTFAPQLALAGISLLVAIIAGITLGLPQLVTSIISLVTTFVNTLAANMGQIITAGTNLLVSFLQGIIINLPRIVETVTTLITTFLTEITLKLPELMQSGADLIIAWLQGMTNHLPDIVNEAFNFISALLQGISDNLPRIISDAVNVITAFIRGIANNISKIVDAGMDLIDKLVSGVLQAQERLFTAAIRLVNGMADNIRNNKDAMRDAALNLIDAMIGVFVPDALYEAGKNIISGLINGIGSMVGEVSKKISEVAGGIKERITGALGIHSPSRWMRDMVGKNMMLGWEIGIDKNADYPQAAMASAIDDVTNQRQGEKSMISRLGQNTATKLNSMLNSRSMPANNQSSPVAVSGYPDAAPQIIEVHVKANIDKRELTREIAEPVRVEINRQDKRSARLKGDT